MIFPPNLIILTQLLGTKPFPTKPQSPEQAGPTGVGVVGGAAPWVDDPDALPACPQSLPRDRSEDQ